MESRNEVCVVWKSDIYRNSSRSKKKTCIIVCIVLLKFKKLAWQAKIKRTTQ